MNAAWVLYRRELTRLWRQPVRLVVGVLTPMLVWAVLAMGLGGALSSGGGGEEGSGDSVGVAVNSYAAFGLPGAAALVVVFSSIFGAISLIEDRSSGYLQAVLIGPTPGWAVAASKLGGSATVACAQAMIVVSVAPLLGLMPGAGNILGVMAAVLCMSVFVAGLALACAWRVGTVAAFHGVMNMVLMPLWLLSGAVFPPEARMGWMDAAAAVNPLGWSLDLMRSLLADPGVARVGGAPVGWLWVGTLCAGVAGALAAVGVMRGASQTTIQ